MWKWIVIYYVILYDIICNSNNVVIIMNFSSYDTILYWLSIKRTDVTKSFIIIYTILVIFDCILHEFF